jgi:hypothetical protein
MDKFKIEISGETAEEVMAQVNRLANVMGALVNDKLDAPGMEVATSDVFDAVNLDVLREKVIERFAREGFTVTILSGAPTPNASNALTPAPEAGEAPPKRGRGRPRLVEQEAAKATLAGEAPKAAEPEAAPESDPEGDRAYVIKWAGKLFMSKHKDDVLAFNADMVKQHAEKPEEDKLSMMRSEPFPAIRVEFEKRFATALHKLREKEKEEAPAI